MPAEVETMMYAREVPWHGLGTKVDGLQTAAEALEAAELSWTVTKQPMTYPLEDGGQGIVPSAWANVRSSDSSVLGVVGDSYQIVQNIEAFDFADSLVDSGAAKYETAGSLMRGRRVFLSMELPDGVSVPGDDGEIKPYLLITNGHDGTTALQASVTMVRVVCANTWTLALKGATRTFRIRHSGSIEGKLAAAHEALGVTFTYTLAFQDVAQRLMGMSLVDRQITRIFKRAFPIPASLDRPDRIDQSDYAKVLAVYRSSPNLDLIRGTGWSVLQATGEYLDHEVQYHGRRFSDEDVRADSILYDGPAAQRKQKVLSLLLAK